ncbi:hypothetical protein AZH46_07130 [Corynebacterium striatum]|nr:hypothetical protein AZH46_07130 [Corynebacterium striatum]
MTNTAPNGTPPYPMMCASQYSPTIQRTPPRSGLALRVARESLGISAAHLAEYLGVGKRTAERWEKLDEIPGWVETALRKITFTTQMWESDLQDAGQVMIHTGGCRMLDGRPLPESWWIHLVGQAMRTNATIIPIAD